MSEERQAGKENKDVGGEDLITEARRHREKLSENVFEPSVCQVCDFVWPCITSRLADALVGSSSIDLYGCKNCSRSSRFHKGAQPTDIEYHYWEPPTTEQIAIRLELQRLIRRSSKPHEHS